MKILPGFLANIFIEMCQKTSWLVERDYHGYCGITFFAGIFAAKDIFAG